MISPAVARRPASAVKILAWLLGMVAAIVWILPFFWMLSTSLKEPSTIMTKEIQWFPSQVTLENYRAVFTAPLLRWLFNSAVVVSLGTLVAVLAGATAGYALARLQFRGRSVLFAVILASIMIPSELSIVPLFIAFLKIGLIDSYLAIALPTFANVMSVYIFRQFFARLPMELEDAARIDGCGQVGIFLRIALPLARAPMTAATVLVFTANWNQYIWPLLVTFSGNMKTMPLGVSQFSPSSGDYAQASSFGPAMAAATLLSIPSLLVFLVLQKFFVEGISRVGLK